MAAVHTCQVAAVTGRPPACGAAAWALDLARECEQRGGASHLRTAPLPLTHYCPPAVMVLTAVMLRGDDPVLSTGKRRGRPRRSHTMGRSPARAEAAQSHLRRGPQGEAPRSPRPPAWPHGKRPGCWGAGRHRGPGSGGATRGPDPLCTVPVVRVTRHASWPRGPVAPACPHRLSPSPPSESHACNALCETDKRTAPRSGPGRPRQRRACLSWIKAGCGAWGPATGPKSEALAVAGGGGAVVSVPLRRHGDREGGQRCCSDLTAAPPFPRAVAERNRRGGRQRPVPTRRAVALYDYDPRESSPNIDAEVPAGPPRRDTHARAPPSSARSPARSDTGKVHPSPVTRYCDS